MVVLCLLLGVACYYDYRQGRIPNYLLILMFILGWGCEVFAQGVRGAVSFPLESLAVMLLLYPLFKIGGLGAGDVKLFGICAGYLPKDKFLMFLFHSLLIAAVISLIKMIKEGNAVERISYLCEYTLGVMQSGQIGLYIRDERERKAAGICLAGPIFCSALLLWGGAY